MKEETCYFAKCTRCGYKIENDSKINKTCWRIMKNKKCRGAYKSTISKWE